jgi:hypothetical protein
MIAKFGVIQLLLFNSYKHTSRHSNRNREDGGCDGEIEQSDSVLLGDEDSLVPSVYTSHIASH